MLTRFADKTDLDAINTVVSEAISVWPMAERAKRLAVTAMSYSPLDFDYFRFTVGLEGNKIVAVVVWDQTSVHATVNGPAKLVHGLYVLPDCQAKGWGKYLLTEAFVSVALDADVVGVLIRADRVSVSFFEHLGLTPLPAQKASDYPYRFWFSL